MCIFTFIFVPQVQQKYFKKMNNKEAETITMVVVQNDMEN